MLWNRDVYKEVKTKHQELYDLLDKKHLMVFKELPMAVVDGVQWFDYSCGGMQDTLLYLKVRGMIVQHNTVVYLYRLKG